MRDRRNVKDDGDVTLSSRRRARLSPRSRARMSKALAILGVLVAVAFAGGVTTPAEAKPPTVNKCLKGRPFGYARSKPDYGRIGNFPYYVSIESLLFDCPGGWVLAQHVVHLDGRWLALGAEVHLEMRTRRSDGRWTEYHRKMTSSKNFSDETYYEIRGVGGGLRVTDVQVNHYAELNGQSMLTWPSTAKAKYGPWNGPEASPGR